MTSLNWGILSTAKINRKMIPALQAAPDCTVVAIASRDETAAATAAADYSIPRSHGSYEALLADPQVEAVYIPVPNHLHVPLTLQAIAADKHVLCEKPLAMQAAEARQVQAAAKAAGRVVAEGFMTRHHPQWLSARNLVRDGGIGRLNAMQAMFSYHNDDPDNVRNRADIGGGALYDIGCYALNAGQFFFEADAEAVACTMDIDTRFGTDRLTGAIIRYPGGRHLTFTVATQSAQRQQMALLGETRAVTLDIPFNCPPDHRARMALHDPRSHDAADDEIEAFDPVDQYALQAASFARAVLEGGSLATTLDETVACAATMEALFRAARSGRWENP